MEYLVTGRQAKAIDTYTIEHTGIPSLVLMERASLTIAKETAQVAAQLKLPAVRIAAVCGSGNNGGDGIAAARILHSKGYDVTIFFAGLREKMSPDCQKQLSIAENLSVPISNDTDLDAYNIIIDAIFGIGLDRPVTGTYKGLDHRRRQCIRKRQQSYCCRYPLRYPLPTVVRSWEPLSMQTEPSPSAISKRDLFFIPVHPVPAKSSAGISVLIRQLQKP
ncbi:MAG: NAD(P)H-hydrate epimerase [Coprococcus sp.]